MAPGKKIILAQPTHGTFEKASQRKIILGLHHKQQQGQKVLHRQGFFQENPIPPRNGDAAGPQSRQQCRLQRAPPLQQNPNIRWGDGPILTGRQALSTGQKIRGGASDGFRDDGCVGLSVMLLCGDQKTDLGVFGGQGDDGMQNNLSGGLSTGGMMGQGALFGG